jgi:hypothetical protein
LPLNIAPHRSKLDAGVGYRPIRAYGVLMVAAVAVDDSQQVREVVGGADHGISPVKSTSMLAFSCTTPRWMITVSMSMSSR